MEKLEAIIKQFEKALIRFTEVLDVPESDIVRDSAIQRFEFTLDLSWKMVKAFLEENNGIICRSPKECFREAYQQGIIKYSDDWMNFVDMRNETVHTYKEEIAEEVYSKLPDVLKHFKDLLAGIKKEVI
ncbi:MAG: HI0074 family nucleotidyltransferase substrate-binding subunit [bacterium]|nr:HI0074 family nucleotidyltransferase substrate-binding subunit [bacterium]